jgi:hypothetical protein
MRGTAVHRECFVLLQLKVTAASYIREGKVPTTWNRNKQNKPEPLSSRRYRHRARRHSIVKINTRQ